MLFDRKLHDFEVFSEKPSNRVIPSKCKCKGPSGHSPNRGYFMVLAEPEIEILYSIDTPKGFSFG